MRGSTLPFQMSHRTTVTHCLAWTLALVFVAAGCAAPRPAGLQADSPDEKAQIERRLHEVLAAAENKDFNRLESYHLYGPKFTRFSASSPARLDAATTRQAEHDGLASLKGLTMQADALQIDVFGPVGIATFILEYSFESGGATLRKKDRSTLVFVRDSGEWKIAHEHLSPIPLTEPGGATNGSQPLRLPENPTSSATGSAR